MRKFFFVRTEIFFLPHGGKFSFEGGVLPSEEKGFFVRKERTFPSDGGELPFGRKFIFLRKAKYFRV